MGIHSGKLNKNCLLSVWENGGMKAWLKYAEVKIGGKDKKSSKLNMAFRNFSVE